MALFRTRPRTRPDADVHGSAIRRTARDGRRWRVLHRAAHGRPGRPPLASAAPCSTRPPGTVSRDGEWPKSDNEPGAFLATLRCFRTTGVATSGKARRRSQETEGVSGSRGSSGGLPTPLDPAWSVIAVRPLPDVATLPCFSTPYSCHWREGCGAGRGAERGRGRGPARVAKGNRPRSRNGYSAASFAGSLLVSLPELQSPCCFQSRP